MALVTPVQYRLAEPLAALSVATDMARGRSPGQALSAARVAAGLAEQMGLPQIEQAHTYFATLLRFAGCTATSHEYATRLGGNDVAIRFGGDSIDPADPVELAALLAQVGDGSLDPAVVMGVVAEGSRADCEVGSRLVSRMGLGEEVANSLLYVFERWDGHGLPNGVWGPEIPLPARIGGVATAAAMFADSGGSSVAIATLNKWSGRILDPAITQTFLNQAHLLLPLLGHPDSWQATLDAEPGRPRMIDESDLDAICRAFADFVDLKTPFFLGHSSHVAGLAEGAARLLGLGESDCTTLRRAALLHDLGRVGVSAGIWEKAEPLGTLDREQAELHPQHTERILEKSSIFKSLARIASAHHERTDGTGYFRGLPASGMSKASRILAAADACAELLEDRPGRPALALQAAGEVLHRQALDHEAVAAVLQSAGLKNPRAGRSAPAGLTRREIEVMRLLARGLSLRQVADELVISYSTAHTHAAHAYEKTGVSTRAGVAFFVMEHGLLA